MQCFQTLTTAKTIHNFHSSLHALNLDCNYHNILLPSHKNNSSSPESNRVPSKKLHKEKTNVCKSQTDTFRRESREIKQTFWQRWGDVSTITPAREKQDPPPTRTEKIHLQLHARHSGLTLLSMWCQCLGVFLTSVYLRFPWRGGKRSLRGHSWRWTPRVGLPWGCLLRQLVLFCWDPKGENLPQLKCFQFYGSSNEDDCQLLQWTSLQWLWLISLEFRNIKNMRDHQT